MNAHQYAPGVLDTHDDLNGYGDVFLIPIPEHIQPPATEPEEGKVMNDTPNS